jgi:hypothetical protein
MRLTVHCEVWVPPTLTFLMPSRSPSLPVAPLKERHGDGLRTRVAESRGSSVSIVTRLRPGLPGFDSRQEQGLFSRHRVQTVSGAHPTSYPMCTGAVSLGVKRPKRAVDHFPPSGAELRMHGGIPALPRYVFMVCGLMNHRDNFTFT